MDSRASLETWRGEKYHVPVGKRETTPVLYVQSVLSHRLRHPIFNTLHTKQNAKHSILLSYHAERECSNGLVILETLL
jgi:hypothetical protein